MLIVPCKVMAEAMKDTIPGVVLERIKGTENLGTLTFRMVDSLTAVNYFNAKQLALGEDTLRICFTPFNGTKTPGWIDFRFLNSKPTVITRVVFTGAFCNNVQPTSMYQWFYNLKKLTSIEGIENLNTSKTTDMTEMFYDCESLTALNLSGWYMKNVKYASGMFCGCKNLKKLKIGTAWISNDDARGNAKAMQKAPDNADGDMSYMFAGCSSIDSLDLRGLNTQNVRNLEYMFGGWYEMKDGFAVYNYDYNLKYIDISNFNTSNVTDMGWMFERCSSLTNVDVSNLKTDNVTNMNNMFSMCQSLTSLDVSNFNTTNVTCMSGMFDGCSSLTSLDIRNFNTDNVTDMSGMFSDLSLASINISNLNTTNVTSMRGMFSYCRKLKSLDLSNFKTANVTDMGSMFNDCSSLTSLDLSNFNTSNVIDMAVMFDGCSSMKNLDLSNFNTSKVTDMQWMFKDCCSLNSLDVSNFNTANVADMSEMFSGCSSLTNIDISNFNTEKVTSLNRMFDGCSSLKILDVSNFNTVKVTDMKRMFHGCSSLTRFAIHTFNTANVTDMSEMFSGCSSLTNLDVSNFNTEKVTSMSGMFYDCYSLKSLDISNFNVTNVLEIGPMFWGCNKLSKLNLGNNDFIKIKNEKKAASFNEVGASNFPCILIIGKDFEKSVMGKETSGNYYEWLSGYFTEPIVGETVVIDSTGYASYTVKDDIDLSQSKEVYAYKANYDAAIQTMKLERVTKAPGNTPLIFMGNIGMQILPTAEATPDPIEDNELKVSEIDITADGSQWILADNTVENISKAKAMRFANDAGNVGFVKVAVGTTIKAGTVYLTIDGVTDRDFIAISNGEPTGIDALKNEQKTAAIYDLNGRKLSKLQRGINILRYEDGTVKKVIVK